MIIAATGLTGGIGKLFPGHVRALKTRLEQSSDEMFRELSALPKVDCVIHMAAMTQLKDCQAHPEKAYQLNVDGATKWFEAATRSQIKHFIFTSTSHVYGNPNSKEPLPTNHPTAPLSVYAKTKVAAEEKLIQLSQHFPQTKLTIARLFSVISKESRPGMLYANLHRRAQEKDFSPVPGLHYVRDFISAESAVEKLMDLTSWTKAPPIVHICSGKGRRVLDLATEVFAEYGLNAEQLLHEGPRADSDIPWIVGRPTLRIEN